MKTQTSNNSLLYRTIAIFTVVMMLLATTPMSPVQAAPLAAVSTPTWFSAANNTTGPVTITPAQLTCAAATNRLLVVMVTAEYNNNPNVMTLTVTKGAALTQAVKTTGNTRTGIWIGYLNDAQITTNAASNIVVTEPAGGNAWQSVNVHAACLTGVDQATPIVAGGTAFNSSDANTGTYAFANVPAVNTGLMIYAAGHNGSNNFTAPGGYTESFDIAGSSLRVTGGFKAVTATGNEGGTITFNNNDRYAAAVISVNPSVAAVAPVITSANATTFTAGVTGNFTVTATGSPAPTFAVTTGTLPTGVTLSAAGVLSGTPAAGTVGAFPITITASNGTLPNATQAFTLTVQKANTTTTINSDTPDPSLAGQNVVVNYTVASAGNAIARTGNVTVSDGVNNCVGTAAAGTCTLALSTVGARTLTATYAGDANFNGSASAGVAHTVSASFIINASAGAGGAITPSGAVAVAGGAAQAFDSTPGSTFILSDVLVDGVSVGRTNSYTFNAVAANHTIASSFNGGWFAPTASAAVTGVINPNNAFTSNNTNAVFNGLGNTVNYTTFGIPGIPAGAIINGIEVAIEGYNSQAAGRNLQVQISWNGGANFTTITAARTTNLPLVDGTVLLGGAADTWGRAWINTEFTNANFVVKTTSTGGALPAVNLDQLQVKVTYTLPLVAPTITSVAPAGGTEGVGYTHTYNATGTTPVTFSLTAGTLPPGLTLTSAGALSGTPTTAGTYNGTVTAANGILPNATQNFSIVIAGIPPTITSAAPLGGTDGVAYNHTYTATGTAPITFSVTAGTLPTGLTLTSAGVLSGTPIIPGTYNGTVTAANGVLPNATQNFSITIAAVAPTITSVAPSNGAQGIAYTHTYTATGSAPITYSLTSGSFPTGLTLTPAGVLSGTPTALGTFTGTVTATNGVLPDDTQNFNITISLAPSITSANNASFSIGTAGTFTVVATGSPAPTLSIAGALPAGVTFVPATGVLSGTPAAGTSGSYPLTFTATNGVIPDAVQNFTLTVTEGPSITSANSTTFSIGLPGTFTVTTAGAPAPTLSLTGSVPALPAGVTFTPATGVLAGTPAAGTVGVYTLTFTATNGILPNATQTFTLTIKNGPIVAPNGINSVPDTGNGSISNNESIVNTLGITHLIVKFDQNVYDPAGDTDPKDVTNPANYMLVLGSSTGTFQTVSCAGGIVAPDVAIAVDSVTYNSSTFVATVNINGGLPLNANGFYRLYVCGTTSIVDANNINLELAGNGTTPGTDFLINFRIRAAGAGGGGGNNTSTSSVAAKAVLIPVTGFAPNKVTDLPAQPADKAYKSLGEIRIEIPTLGINFPVVGVMFDNNNWDLTWLKDSVGYLEGSAYPTLAGNTVLTAHVRDANKNLGPFSDIKGLQVGQQIYIHAYGQTYIYQVQENTKILPSNISAAFKHEENSWITLVTCEDYNAKTELYTQRRMVRAVLISVISKK